MTLTKKEYAEIDKITNQPLSEKCDSCNNPDGYHHLCKGKKCKCFICKDRYKK